MRVLMITANDPAGMGIAFTNAINRYTEHTCRLITTAEKYGFDYEKDIHIPDIEDDDFEEIDRLLREADIIHFHILADESMELGPIKVKDYIRGKRVLHHHHGHPDFRANPKKYSQKYKKLRRKVLVSTPDLLRLVPEANWQPNLVPINDPPYLPLSGGGNGRIRICHSPTRKDLKNTVEFNVAVESLKGKYDNLEKVVIENTPHQECLRIKQQCDIHFDHCQGYYGVSSLEGLSQGKPVIAGLDEWNIECIKEFTDSDKLPWVTAQNQDELQDKLKKLITDSEMRNNIGMQSRRFMEHHWTEQHVLHPLLRFYESL